MLNTYRIEDVHEQSSVLQNVRAHTHTAYDLAIIMSNCTLKFVHITGTDAGQTCVIRKCCRHDNTTKQKACYM